MKQPKRRCKHCGCLFDPCPKVAKHAYCRKKQCQRARKRIWQKKRLDENPRYRQDQKAAQQLWQENSPDYWGKYRQRNQPYTDGNREKQRDRNRRRRHPGGAEAVIAKMDAIKQENNIFSGRYRLIPLTPDVIAKMDTIIVEIKDISAAYNEIGSVIAKMDV